jgi:ribosomal-protein-alanine N-acetyltransferase
MDVAEDLPGSIRLRLLAEGDLPELVRAYTENREHLAPWDPVRSESFFTDEGQREIIERHLGQMADGTMLPLVLEDAADGAPRIIGRATLTGIEHGPYQNARLGYWIAHSHTGRGIMGRAVSAVTVIARDTLGLHRLEASTLPHNTASQRVLLRNGFTQIGLAPQYLQIAGAWQDHCLFQRILHS